MAQRSQDLLANAEFIRLADAIVEVNSAHEMNGYIGEMNLDEGTWRASNRTSGGIMTKVCSYRCLFVKRKI